MPAPHRSGLIDRSGLVREIVVVQMVLGAKLAVCFAPNLDRLVFENQNPALQAFHLSARMHPRPVFFEIHVQPSGYWRREQASGPSLAAPTMQ